MKFLITGALNRPGGPRLLVLGGAALMFVYEVCMLALSLLSAKDPAPETIAIALEEIHIVFFMRGMEALFLGSVLIGLPAPAVLRRWLPLTLFVFPGIAAGLHLLSSGLPSAYLASIFFSCASSILAVGVQILIVWKLYAR